MLNDPVTAQYTHTLTVSIEGEYTCTVANNKPSSASASITLRAPETPIVRVVSTTATSVTLSCTDPSDAAVISHVLHWQGDLPVACSDTNEGTTAFHTDETVIDGLEEGIAYKMSVTAINLVGSSKVSQTVTAITKEAAPTGSPTSVMTSDITDTSISLRWEEVPCLHRNGEITGYTVLVGNGGANRLVEVAGDLRETNISGLVPSTEYTIQVAAVNSAGTGPYSDGSVYKTKAATYAGGEDASSCTCPKADNTGAVIGGAVVSVITVVVIIKVVMIMVSRKYGENSTHDRKSPASAPTTSNFNEAVLNEAYNAVERVEESDSVYEEVSFEPSPSSTI